MSPSAISNYTDPALAVSNPVDDLGVSDYGLQREQVRPLHNGIDVIRFVKVAPNARQRVRRELGFDGEAKVIGIIGIIGRLAEMKSQSYAIRAIQNVSLQMVGAVLMLVGEGHTGFDGAKICAGSIGR